MTEKTPTAAQLDEAAAAAAAAIQAARDELARVAEARADLADRDRRAAVKALRKKIDTEVGRTASDAAVLEDALDTLQDAAIAVLALTAERNARLAEHRDALQSLGAPRSFGIAPVPSPKWEHLAPATNERDVLVVDRTRLRRLDGAGLVDSTIAAAKDKAAGRTPATSRPTLVDSMSSTAPAPEQQRYFVAPGGVFAYTDDALRKFESYQWRQYSEELTEEDALRIAWDELSLADVRVARRTFPVEPLTDATGVAA